MAREQQGDDLKNRREEVERIDPEEFLKSRMKQRMDDSKRKRESDFKSFVENSVMEMNISKELKEKILNKYDQEGNINNALTEQEFKDIPRESRLAVLYLLDIIHS